MATWSEVIQLSKFMSCHPPFRLLVAASACMGGRSKDTYLISYIRSPERGQLNMYGMKISNIGAVH